MKEAIYRLPSGPELRLYPMAETLRVAHKRFLRSRGRSDYCSDDTLGVVSASRMTSKELFSYPLYCVIFLAEDQLGAGYVAHECLHAALYLDKFRHGQVFTWDYDELSNNERLCYLHGDIVRDVWATIYDNGHAKPKELFHPNLVSRAS